MKQNAGIHENKFLLHLFQHHYNVRGKILEKEFKEFLVNWILSIFFLDYWSIDFLNLFVM